MPIALSACALSVVVFSVTALGRSPGSALRGRDRAAASLCLAAALLLAGALPTPAAEPAPLRVAVDAPYPPFAYIDKTSGNLAGFDVDIIQALCLHLNRTCEIKNVPFDKIIPSITAGNIDIAIAGMSKTEERQRHVIFTDKYFRSNSMFIELARSPAHTTPHRFEGKNIAVQRDTVQEKYLRDGKAGKVNVISLQNSEEVYEALRQHKADFAFLDGLPGYYFLTTEEGSMFEIVGEPVLMPTTGPAHIVLHPSLTEVRDALNKGIAELRKNGTYDIINRKYFSFSIY